VAARARGALKAAETGAVECSWRRGEKPGCAGWGECSLEEGVDLKAEAAWHDGLGSFMPAVSGWLDHVNEGLQLSAILYNDVVDTSGGQEQQVPPDMVLGPFS